MDFCEANGIDYVFGLTGTKALAAKLEDVADAVRVERARRGPGRRARLRRDHASGQVLGQSSAGSPPASRPPAWASTSATS